VKAVALLLACASMVASAFAQGTINFTNMKPTKQQVFDIDGEPLTEAWAQLYAGRTVNSMKVYGKSVEFFNDFKKGFFNDGVVEVDFLWLGVFQIRAWKGAETIDKAAQGGKSNILHLSPGDPTLGGVPDIPKDLIGLKSLSLKKINEPVKPTKLKITGATVFPFAFTFAMAKGVTYEVQASSDLVTWGELKKMKGTSGETKFTDYRKARFARQYYRVKQTE
jgi:hypothetical protein